MKNIFDVCESNAEWNTCLTYDVNLTCLTYDVNLIITVFVLRGFGVYITSNKYLYDITLLCG